MFDTLAESISDKLLGRRVPELPPGKLVLVVRLTEHLPWVRLDPKQCSRFEHGFVWGVVDTANGRTLSVHKSKKAAMKEAAWYNKTDHAIAIQLASGSSWAIE